MAEFSPLEEDKGLPRGADGGLPRLAARQHGLVTTAQLAAAGLSSTAVRRRVTAGRLHRIHRGVYAVGHPGLTFEARCLAAVLAGGPGSRLCGAAAAGLWRIRPEPPEPFDVVTTVRGRGGPATVVLHCVRHPPPATRHRGIPVTTVPQTLLDLTATVSQAELERAVREAHALWLVRHEDIARFVEKSIGLPGAPALREALGLERGSRSALERAFLDLCRRFSLELPLLNQTVAGIDVDFLWPAHRLVVEVDGGATHATRHGFERDREIDARLARAGFRVQRFSRRQVLHRQQEVAETLRALGV